MNSIRSLYWPGFVLGLLLMTGISCAGLAAFFGINQLTLLDIQASGEPVWTPLPPTSTPETQLAEAPRASLDISTFAAGETVRNITGSRVNIRLSPGHRGKTGDDILAQAQPGDSLTIIAGPQEEDGLLWWLIRYQTRAGATLEGWMAEATSSGVTIMGP